MNFTTKKIMELNLKILQEINLDRKTNIEYLKKLKGYKYVDELTDLKHGAFIRWIPITNPEYLPLNLIPELNTLSTNLIVKIFRQLNFHQKSGKKFIITFYFH